MTAHRRTNTMKTSRTQFLSTTIALGLVLAAGCNAADIPEDEDPDFIEASVEDEFGGFDMEDEAPMFGDAAIFDELDLNDTETAITDDFASDAEVLAVTDAADAVVDDVLVLVGDGELDQDYELDASVDGGILIATSGIRIAGRDAITRRTDNRRIIAALRTRRHLAGLRLRLAARADNAASRTLRLRINGVDHDIDVDRLLDAPESRDLSADGDRVVVVARRRPVDTCDHGFMRGQWLQMGRGFGALRARVSNSDGEGIGHLRGLYGVRRNGERVFFGKYINRAGQFKGIFAGKYRNGHFAGRWLARGGDHGVLGGRYRETRPGVRHGGALAGRWAETSCRGRISDQLPSD